MRRKLQVEPYWYVIGAFIVAAGFLFIRHLTGGDTPDRVALTVPVLDFDIYWYGIIIVAGIALGAYVTSKLAGERAEQTFQEEVRADIRRVPISALELPLELERRLRKLSLGTLGAILYQWGLNSMVPGLKDPENATLREKLSAHDGIDEQWLEDAPWRQWNPEYVWSGVVWTLVFAIVGARLYHILTPSPSMAEIGINSALDYFRHPLQLVNIRSGGLGIYGAVIGGLLGLFVFSKRQRISTIAWADLAVVGLALGQVIGRWGNFFNQELYGQPTDLPWAIKIDPANRLNDFTQFETFHPTFLYASIWSLITFLILLRLARKHRQSLYTGDITAAYFLLFATGRILTELVRLDSRTFAIGSLDFGMPIASVVSLVIGVAMAALLIWRHVISKPPLKA
ncbi:MAG TPA: prolipoprotein diacylglyceryl transferase [candidate division Zixibacteria bacterium]|nr:prolipoprotein diacylglyceryl transferase [candidate division Zixibacteria bacterium]